MGVGGSQDPRPARSLGLPQSAHADRRADVALRARPGRGDRHRREGDVLLAGRDERRSADAATGSHGGHRARHQRAQRAVQRPAAHLADGADVPPRAAAKGAHAPVSSARCRGPGPCRAGCRCRIDPDAARTVARTGPQRGRAHRARAQQPGPARRAQGASRRLDCALRSQRRPSGRRGPAAPAQQSVAHSRYQESGHERGGRERARADGLPRARIAGAFQRSACSARRGRSGLQRQPAPGARHGLLQPHGLRVEE